MHFLDLTLPTPAENLALDEALLAACEAGENTGGVLRIWEPEDYFVVLGRSSDPAVEVNLAACRASKVSVLRRVSGGGTILAGPGCLMYAVVLSLQDYPEAKSIPRAHRFVLGRIAKSLSILVPGVTCAGTSDLAFVSGETLLKFSGNALRMKRCHFVYHGTLLYDFDLARVGQLLALQTREPLYRLQRTHQDFVANLPINREQLIAALVDAWQARENLPAWPRESVQRIVDDKYSGCSFWITA
jgi:lipoate---protein ligase